MALSDIDRRLLQRCLAGEPRSWEEFVDRFMGLVLHVIDHTAQIRAYQLTAEDREDLLSEIFLALVRDNLSVLRRFRGESSLATYLTVVARRVAMRRLTERLQATPLESARDANVESHEHRIQDEEQLERMLSQLSGPEAEVVRLYHLEGKSYREISEQTGIPENTVGPTLSRARSKMRASVNSI